MDAVLLDDAVISIIYKRYMHSIRARPLGNNTPMDRGTGYSVRLKRLGEMGILYSKEGR